MFFKALLVDKHIIEYNRLLKKTPDQRQALHLGLAAAGGHLVYSLFLLAPFFFVPIL